MNFSFHLESCAMSNSSTAKLREAQRMACLALGLSRIGQDIRIVDVASEFARSPRWEPFAHLSGSDNDGIQVWPAESILRQKKHADVAFKCSVGTKKDDTLVGLCELLIAHEYDPLIDGDPGLLPIPFSVHDSALDEFLKDGMFEAFIDNDLEKIRSFYCRPKSGLLGMRACSHWHRARFIENAPEWADVSLYTYQPTGGFIPSEFLRWISTFRGGLCLPGTTPKSNLPPLLALLGVAIVAPPFPEKCRDMPPLSKANSIIFDSWEQVHSELSDDARVREVVAQMDADWICGWSPKGLAQLVTERLK